MMRNKIEEILEYVKEFWWVIAIFIGAIILVVILYNTGVITTGEVNNITTVKNTVPLQTANTVLMMTVAGI